MQSYLHTYVLYMNCCALSTVCRRPYHVEIRHLVQTGSGLIGEGNINNAVESETNTYSSTLLKSDDEFTKLLSITILVSHIKNINGL